MCTCVCVLQYEGKCKWCYGPSCPVHFPLNIFIHSFIHMLALFCQGVLGLGDGLGEGRPRGAGRGVPKLTHRGASPAPGGVCYLRLPRVTHAAVCQGVLGLGDGLGEGRPRGAGSRRVALE